MTLAQMLHEWALHDLGHMRQIAELVWVVSHQNILKLFEKVPAALAVEVTSTLAIPTIGIGAGPGCDGQILVSYDMLGLFERFRPRFVRRYSELGEEIRRAVRAFGEDVRGGSFPSDDECY